MGLRTWTAKIGGREIQIKAILKSRAYRQAGDMMVRAGLYCLAFEAYWRGRQRQKALEIAYYRPMLERGRR